MLSSLRVKAVRARLAMTAGHRTTECRRGAHTWTDRADPPACIHCGRSQVAPQQERPAAA